MCELDWQRRVSAIERHVAKLELELQEIEHIVDPQGWIGEAFKTLEHHVDSRMDTLESKLDAFLQRLTGYKKL
jgi:DNA repair exonuclease SbcCD ATPase subunit